MDRVITVVFDAIAIPGLLYGLYRLPGAIREMMTDWEEDRG